MSNEVRVSRGVVFHRNQIVFLHDDWVEGVAVGSESTVGENLQRISPTPFNRPVRRMSRKAHAKFRHQCMRDTLVYETDRKELHQYKESDFPLTPERPVGRIEGVSDPSSDPAEQPCPRDPDTSGSET